MRSLVRRFLQDVRAVALIEFALILPFMILLLLGTMEISRYYIILYRFNEAVFVMNNTIGQYKPATTDNAAGELTAMEITSQIVPLFSRIMGFYADENRQGVVFTSVVRTDSTAGSFKMAWRYANLGAGVGSFTSVVPGSVATTSDSSSGFSGQQLTYQWPSMTPIYKTNCPTISFSAQMATELVTTLPRENFIVGEAIYAYRPLYTMIYPPARRAGWTMQRAIFQHPRNGDLLRLPTSAASPQGGHPVPNNSATVVCK